MSNDSIGRSIAHYRVTAKLGEGGMGEVYRATDTKLKREVAIKLLPPAFTEDKERLARFEREAQLLAQLHHPNIASIFGIEESDGTRALVMELVEGPTLAERLEQGPLPINESLSVSLQIALALEEAHEKGIVHRDLKPQNVKASIEGKVKVLDFGLAKAMDPTGAASGSGAGSVSQLAQSPTLTLGATQMGVILGTAAYMAPEQAVGGAVDRRADIWAFGVVLYEMLTGKRLFEGETVSHVLASVLKDAPDFGALPAETPERIRNLVRRCLRRKPRERLQSIGDARLVLEEVIAEPERDRPADSTAVAGVAAAPRGTKLAWFAAAAGIAAAGLFAALWLGSSRGATDGRRLHAAIVAPDGTGLGDSFALSPDGGRLVFEAYDEEGRVALWLRDLATGEARRLGGTEGGELPFWSPDGRQIAFFSEGKLRRLDPRTGAPQLICEAPTPRGGSWSDDGRIVFSPAFRTGLSIVPATGGAPQILTTLDEARGEKSHRFPVFLPGGKRLLFLAQTAEGGRATTRAPSRRSTSRADGAPASSPPTRRRSTPQAAISSTGEKAPSSRSASAPNASTSRPIRFRSPPTSPTTRTSRCWPRLPATARSFSRPEVAACSRPSAGSTVAASTPTPFASASSSTRISPSPTTVAALRMG